jgi:hypothetical protein
LIGHIYIGFACNGVAFGFGLRGACCLVACGVGLSLIWILWFLAFP